jgi:hypothetical protein
MYRHSVVSEPAHELMADDVPVGIQYITFLTCFGIPIFNRLVPMANPESPQIKLFHECGQGFKTRDPVLIAKTLHKDYRYVTYPRSLGRPDQTKDEWLKHWADIIGLWTADLEVSYIGCSSDPFAATKSLPQQTYHFFIDTPGKIIAHVRIWNAQIYHIYLRNAAPTSQMTHKAKISIGVESTRESILIVHIVSDEDGSLKIKQVEEFTDSKAELDLVQAITAAGVGG